jgi:CubicO group peptidase (beta-lactamase class C family)
MAKPVGYRAPRMVLGGAGIVSTANDYALFAQMLLNGGELNGVRILSTRAVDLLWRNQLNPNQLPYGLNGWTSDAFTGYGFGVAISVSEPVKYINWDEHTGSDRIGEIGWGGGATTNWQVRDLNGIPEGVGPI